MPCIKSALFVNAFSHVDEIMLNSINNFIKQFKNETKESQHKILNFLQLIIYSNHLSDDQQKLLRKQNDLKLIDRMFVLKGRSLFPV